MFCAGFSVFEQLLWVFMGTFHLIHRFIFFILSKLCFCLQLLSMLINAAYKPGRVLKELQELEDQKWDCQEETLKAKWADQNTQSIREPTPGGRTDSDLISSFSGRNCTHLGSCEIIVPQAFMITIPWIITVQEIIWSFPLRKLLAGFSVLWPHESILHPSIEFVPPVFFLWSLHFLLLLAALSQIIPPLWAVFTVVL